MTKTIKIGSCLYNIQYTPETANGILNKVIQWMEDPDNYAAHSGEGIMQSDNTVISAPECLADIVDEYLCPRFVAEAGESRNIREELDTDLFELGVPVGEIEGILNFWESKYNITPKQT
jgi:hypothetical protein